MHTRMLLTGVLFVSFLSAYSPLIFRDDDSSPNADLPDEEAPPPRVPTYQEKQQQVYKRHSTPLPDKAISQQQHTIHGLFDASGVPNAYHYVKNRRVSGPPACPLSPDDWKKTILPAQDTVEYVNHDWLRSNGYAIRFPTDSIRSHQPKGRRLSGVASSRRRSILASESSPNRTSDTSSESGAVMIEQLEMPHSILLGADATFHAKASNNPLKHAIVHK